MAVPLQIPSPFFKATFVDVDEEFVHVMCTSGASITVWCRKAIGWQVQGSRQRSASDSGSQRKFGGKNGERIGGVRSSGYEVTDMYTGG